MIINCINCEKKFEVNSSLIPKNGRTIQCGVCNHIWIYKPKTNVSENETNSEIIDPSSIEEETQIENDISQDQDKSPTNVIDNNNEITNKKIKKKNKKNSLSIIKFFSYILVLVISFIAIIVILDTFKSSLSNVYPDLEIFLYNLFETVKDIYLFLKNLLS
tara:strand:+ start:71 stop:553 length:483 start_codon:yes stop_codon:yes gene_type:complete